MVRVVGSCDSGSLSTLAWTIPCNRFQRPRVFPFQYLLELLGGERSGKGIFMSFVCFQCWEANSGTAFQANALLLIYVTSVSTFIFFLHIW